MLRRWSISLDDNMHAPLTVCCVHGFSLKIANDSAMALYPDYNITKYLGDGTY